MYVQQINNSSLFNYVLASKASSCWCIWRVRWSYVSFRQLRQPDIHISYRDTHLRMLAGSFSSILTLLIAFTHSSVSHWKAIKMWRETGKTGSCWGLASLKGPLVNLDFRSRAKNRPHRTRSMHEHSLWLCLLLLLLLPEEFSCFFPLFFTGVFITLILLAVQTAWL